MNPVPSPGRVVIVGSGLSGLVSAVLLAALGGRLLLRNAATAILHDGTRATAVVDARGQRHDADLVITTCHPDLVVAMTGEQGFRPSFKARVAAIPDSAGAFLLAAELSEPAVGLGRRHHLLRLADGSDGYVVAPDAWGEAQPPSIEAMVWLDTAAVAAWRSSTVGRRPGDYVAWKSAQEVRLRQALAAHFPWLTPTIRRTWLATPLTFRDSPWPFVCGCRSWLT